MARPCCKRYVGVMPASYHFKPRGIPLRDLEENTLTLDEIEALRLADLEGLYQEQAAQEMSVSRATFARIVESARRKVADALVHGKALRIEGGNIKWKGDPIMPRGDGTGPMGTGQGRGMGPCGCGQRRGKGAQQGAGFQRRGRAWKTVESDRASDPVERNTSIEKEKGQS
ncbi:MAG: DUF134 domain-containing protein [bacterium]|nr:DUF134 domain-containing protein [bacterium]